DASFELKTGSVGAGDLQSRGRNIGSVDLGARQFFGQRQRYAARTGADIGDAEQSGGQGRPPHTSEHRLDYVFGLRTRNEHVRRNDEVHAPEFLMSGDVLRGHAAFALVQGVVVAALFFR